MHLACEGCLVACVSEIMGVCGCIGHDRAGVVIGADLGGKLTADQAHARWSTQWGVAVGRVENHGSLCKFIQIWSLDLRSWVVHLQQGGCELVCHDEEDVWLRGKKRSRESVGALKAIGR